MRMLYFLMACYQADHPCYLPAVSRKISGARPVQDWPDAGIATLSGIFMRSDRRKYFVGFPPDAAETQ